MFFGPPNNTGVLHANLVKGQRKPGGKGGGEHHTFGACDRCQSSAVFSSFLCFSGRFTSSSTQQGLPSLPSLCRSSSPPSGSIWGKVEVGGGEGGFLEES